MAERNRRGSDAAEEPFDEVLDDAVDDDGELEEPVGSGGTATRERRQAGDERAVRSRQDGDRVGIFSRVGRFVREVIAELRKVIWPTRKELLTYTAVVVVFVAVMLTIVGLMDLGFARATLWVFGN